MSSSDSSLSTGGRLSWNRGPSPSALIPPPRSLAQIIRAVSAPPTVNRVESSWAHRTLVTWALWPTYRLNRAYWPWGDERHNRWDNLDSQNLQGKCLKMVTLNLKKINPQVKHVSAHNKGRSHAKQLRNKENKETEGQSCIIVLCLQAPCWPKKNVGSISSLLNASGGASSTELSFFCMHRSSITYNKVTCDLPVTHIWP